MMQGSKILVYIVLMSIASTIVLSHHSEACKDIIAVGDATKGDYNLLLKVRDPSRPGPQVLCIVPKGHTYCFHHPWTGKTQQYTVKHKYIGVATKGDTIPNIVKAGMAINQQGIAFGDADTNSNWKNPTKNAWDDFDWIRYACEMADDEDQAVKLLTEDVVDDLHASGVSENLFVVGPQKAYLIEADAFHYAIKAVKDVVVMSNYPKLLWRTQLHKKLPIASSFSMEKEQEVMQGKILRLNSVYGVKIVEIGNEYIIARQVPFFKINNGVRIVGKKVTIDLGDRETVGDYSVKLLDINGRKATINLCYVFKAWEDKMLEYITPHHGNIGISEMMNWSRLTGKDLDGLRPMCEEIYPYESVMIYKIPTKNYDILSCGWFSANHACSSIYVPVHSCDNDIYSPYLTGVAAEASLELLEIYGNEGLEPFICSIEDVFVYETAIIEELAEQLLQTKTEVSDMLTISDMGMQKQAILTQQIWNEIHHKDFKEIKLIQEMWQNNYSLSLEMMKNAVHSFSSNHHFSIGKKIIEIALCICETKMNIAQSLGKDITTGNKEFQTGQQYVKQGKYESGFDHLLKSLSYSTMILEGQNILNENKGSTHTKNDSILWTDFNIFLVIVLCSTIFVILIRKKY